MTKEEKELKCGQIFARYLKLEHNLEYQAFLPRCVETRIPKNYPDIDVVLLSPLEFNPLFLQLSVDFKYCSSVKNKLSGKTTIFTNRTIDAVIEKKEKKYKKQKKDYSNIILIIQGEHSPNEAQSFINCDLPEQIKTEFLGIYYTSPTTHVIGSTSGIPGWKEFVIPIKSVEIKKQFKQKLNPKIPIMFE